MLAKVHIARKELALDEVAYRAVLMSATGKASAKDCSERELNAALAEFRRLGWQPKGGPTKKSDKLHVRKVFAIWGDLGRSGALANASREALRAFVKRQTDVADPEWLTAAQANLVTEALKAMQRRHASKGAA
ncbi:gp16 family protein [Phreatobacter stygius]|nr:regulatory protein GemA [Phreatobacter stygius]